MLCNAVPRLFKASPPCLLLAPLFLTLSAFGQGPVVRTDLHHDVSPPLSDLVKVAPTGELAKSEPEESDEIRLIPLPPGLKPAEEPDTVLQTTNLKPLAPLSPTVGRNFEGLGVGIPNFTIIGAPPDTNGAVGLTQYVQWVNTSFAVFDKATGNLVSGPNLGKTLWAGFGGNCETLNSGDPIVLYDKLENRWVFTQFALPASPPYLQCIAVSTSSDAMGTFNRYSFQYDSFNDYPKMGVWPDAYYTTFNMFGPGFVGSEACAYDRNAMLAGRPATQICFQQQNTSIGSLLPSDVDGITPPPLGAPNFILSFGANSLKLFKFHADFVTPSNSLFTGPTTIPVAPFTPLCTGRNCVPQAGTSQLLDGLADRLMYRLAYRNFGDHQSLVVNHSVLVGSGSDVRGGIRWYELRDPNGTPTVAQQGTFSPDSSYRWMGSIAMNRGGEIAVGYSVSSSSLFPSIAIAGRTPADPPGALEDEVAIMAGTGSQQQGLSRWGDYSAMQVDPSDDCTFWYTTEYLKTSGTFNWNTRIASLKFPACELPNLTISGTHSGNFTQGQTGAIYSLTVKNIGDKDSADIVTVADTLPAGVTATSAAGTGWSCTLGNPVTCTRGDSLPVSNSYPDITLTVDVANDAAWSVVNTATVSGGGDGDPANNTSNDPTTIVQQGPDLNVAKSHAGSFFQGQTGTYTLVVGNVGLSPTSGTVTVTDSLPAGLTFSAATGQGWTCASGPPTTCTRADALASNASYPPITLIANVDNSALKTITNSVIVSGGGNQNTLNDTASDLTNIILGPDLAITKTHTGDFVKGQVSVPYFINVSNVGGSPTSGTVTVTDSIPLGLTLSFFSTGGWTCSVASRIVTCTRADVLLAGASYGGISLFVNVDANAPNSVTNTATVAGGGEFNTSNDSASDPTNLITPPDLAITSTHTGNFTEGQIGAVYTLTVTNVGNGAASGLVTVNDNIPSGMTVTAAAGTGWNCAISFGFVGCSRSDGLAAGAGYPPITITVNVGGVSPFIGNFGSVNIAGDINVSNNFFSDATNVIVADLAISQAHSGTFVAGQIGASYTITVSNMGSVQALGSVQVGGLLPSGAITLATGTGWGCSTGGSSLSCSRSDPLAAGASYPPLTVNANIDPNAPVSVTNNVNVSTAGDSNSGNNFSSVVIPVSPLGLALSSNSNLTVTAGGVAPLDFRANLSVGSRVNLGTVTFTASGLPPNATITFNPPTVTAAQSIAVAIVTSGNGHTASMVSPTTRFAPLFATLFFPIFAVIGTSMVWRRKNNSRWWLGYVSVLVLILSFVGCGGGSSTGSTPNPTPTPVAVVTPPGTYQITITGTSSASGVAPATTTVSLTVQ